MMTSFPDGLFADKSILRFTRFAPYSPSNDTARLALTQWIRSAAQRNVDALVKVGDYYYHGLKSPKSKGVPQDCHLAQQHYDSALEANQEAYLPVVISPLQLHIKLRCFTK